MASLVAEGVGMKPLQLSDDPHSMSPQAVKDGALERGKFALPGI